MIKFNKHKMYYLKINCTASTILKKGNQGISLNWGGKDNIISKEKPKYDKNPQDI